MAIETGGGVKVLCQTATEILQRQNAEFLERYPTDDAQIEYYTGLAMKLWDEFEIDGAYEPEGTRKNIETWYANKRKQMELFRKHPYWCEEAKSIIFAQEETRECNYVNAKEAIYQLRVYLHRRNGYLPAGDNILEAIYETLDYIHDEPDNVQPVITQRFVDVFNRKNCTNLPKGAKRMLSVGTKLSRFVRKCCEEFQMRDGSIVDVTKFEDEHEPGDRTFDSFEKRYAKFADSLSTLKIKKMTIMSLNFLDFMTMSNGNSWSTCHFINSHGIFHGGNTSSSYRGAYKQGCLSYALDEPSFILYTLPTDYYGTDYYRCQKLTRMCCQYSDGVLITGKCYPNNEDSLITTYRNTMQTVISSIEEIPNRWTFSKDTDKISEFVTTAHGAAHYADYLRGGQKPTISLCTKISFDLSEPMRIGHKGYCLHCGREIDAGSSWLQCTRHHIRMVCGGCGKKITDDETYRDINGRLYCSDCHFYCAVHERYERVSELHGTVLMKDGEVKVCNEAFELLAQCVDCGVWGYKEKMLKTTHGYSCKKHVRKYTKCDWCGVYVLNAEKHVHDSGSAYCPECAERHANLRFQLVRKDSYSAGDYVVVEDDVSCCDNGANEYMMTCYPGKIVKIKRVSYDGDDYWWTTLAEDRCGREYGWNWSKNCIRCAIVGVDDSFIGKRLDAIM